MNLASLHQLPTAALRALSSSLREGVLSIGITRMSIQQIAGPNAANVENALHELEQERMTPSQIAVVIDAVADERGTHPDSARLFDLVLSGPELPGVPTQDTAAVVRTLIAGAQHEVLLVTYAIYDGSVLFEPLVTRMREVPGLKVTLCVHIGREYGDTSTTNTQIITKYGADFRRWHWPWPELPVVIYDPRSLNTQSDERASMHAKCVAVDRKRALISSANFTAAAQKKNIEAGVLVHHEPTVERLVSYFEGLRSGGQLVDMWMSA